MNIEKIKNIFYKIMLSIVLVLVTYVTYCSIFNIYGVSEDLKPIVIIIGIIVTIFLFIKLKRLLGKINENKSNIVAIFLCVMFFIGLSVMGSIETSIPAYDLSFLQKEAMAMLESGGSFVNSEYFSRFTNQVPVTILIYYIYSIGNFLGFGNLRVFATIINSLFIAITAFFTYLSVKKLSNHKNALMTLIFFAINPIFYLYTSFFYTDTLSMPFAASAFYLFVSAIKTQTEKRNMTIIKLIFAGALLALGFKIRVVVGILLIGMIIGLFLNNKFTKRLIIYISSLILGFLIGILMYTAISLPFNAPDDKNIKFPPTHFIVMGLNQEYDGGYSEKDWNYTNNSGNYEEKLQAGLNAIKKRMNDLGIKGWISLSKVKLSRTWANGDYDYISKLTNVENINKLYEYVAGNRRIFLIYYCQICKATILLLFGVSIFKELIKRKKEKLYSVIYISIFGAFLFYLMWEALSRYSLTFLPWMMVAFGVGIEQFEKIINIRNIKINFKDNSEFFINTENIKKGIIIGTCICTMFILAINYFEYTEKEYLCWDKRVMQYREKGNLINELSNNVIQQSFKTDKSFNCISIKLKKQNTTSTTHYNFILKNSNGKIIATSKFTSDEVVHDQLKTFYFSKINPNENEEYFIEINSEDATNGNSIGIATFFEENYTAYEDGFLKINGQVSEGDLVFHVQNEVIRPYTSKKVYIFLSMIVIVVEIFAFYPYLKKGKKIKEE